MHKKFQGRLKLFVGQIGICLAGMATIGCEAGLCTLFTFPDVAKSYKNMIKHIQKCDLESARKEQDKMIDAELAHLKSGNYFLSIKTSFNELVRPLGMDFGFPRPPISNHYKLI